MLIASWEKDVSCSSDVFSTIFSASWFLNNSSWYWLFTSSTDSLRFSETTSLSSFKAFAPWDIGFVVLFEKVNDAVPSELAKNISESLKIPVIGIGAGAEVDGQIMVNYDLLGITQMEKPPKFVKNYLQDASSIEEAIRSYVSEVKEKKFPGIEHSFK